MFSVKANFEIMKDDKPFANFSIQYFGMDYSNVVDMENLIVGGLLAKANAQK